MRVIISGGGTGGHINPALAIARYIQSREPGSEILFCGGRGGLEEKLVPREGFKLVTYPLKGLKRRLTPSGLAHNARALWQAAQAAQAARRMVRDFAPDVVVGCGGYASYPVVRAAQRLKVPTAVLEVNALPGVTTRALAKEAGAVMICFPESRDYFPGGNVVLTGNPVRGEFLKVNREQARWELGLDGRPLIVSVWGSLGAEYMNRCMADFIALEAKHDRHQLIHAIGSYGYAWVPELIAQKGVNLSEHTNIQVRDYIYDMPRVLAAADLVLARGGAATLAELALLGRPALIVPSPNVAENHQEKNARALESAGAAAVRTEAGLTGQELYQTAARLLDDPALLREMGKNIRKFAAPDALDRIFTCICGLTREKDGEKAR